MTIYTCTGCCFYSMYEANYKRHLLSKKHILSILIGIELFLNGINLFFITICKSFSDDIANIFILFILVITACEVAIGLAIFLLNQRINKTIDINSLDRLRDN